MKKKCEQCGEYYEATGNTKYCSNTCRKQVRQEKRKQYNRRYYCNHKRKIKTRRCRYCGHLFTTTGNKRYCSFKCRLHSKREQSLRSSRKYTLRFGVNEKTRYFSNLGNSNLRQNRCKIMKQEYQKILAEKRRLGIV